MDNQSSTGGSIVPVKKDGENLVDEKIDERILRLLELEYIFDIDYDTYASLLKEKMVAARMAKTQIPTEEAELLTNEYKKIRGKKGRFKVKKITAQSLKKGSAVGVNLGKQKALVGKPLKALPPADKMTGGNDIKEIIDALAEIIKSLTSQNKLTKSSAEKSRIAGEAGQRGEKESRLEKGFKFAIQTAEKVIAPIKSALQRIIDFFVAIFVGRALIKLIDWFSDSKNQDKIRAIGRFLGDHWPKLLALYLVFGTGLGKFVGFLSKVVIGGSLRLAGLAATLLAKAGVGKAAGAAKFLGGKGGRFLGAGLQVAAAIGTTMLAESAIKNVAGEDKPEEPKKPGYSGGGSVKIPAFKGGGLNFKGMMGGAGMGAMFGPMGMLLGGALGSGKPQEMVDGFVSGEKGVDKVPAMLSDGEFVMSVGAVQKYGVDTLEGMNAAGGGTNRPKMMGGKTYAAGGGPIGDVPEGLLSPDQPWVKKPRPITWEILKAKLTGGTHNGTTYQSSLNLSGIDADKLIENLKKDPRGYPQVDINGKYGGMENLQKYQKWLKETYLPQSKLTPQPQSKLTPQPQSSTKIGSALDNKPSGGYLGDYMKDKVKMRQATVFERTGESQRLKDLLGVRTNAEAAKIVSTAGNKVPDVSGLLGDKEFSRFNQGAFNKFSEGADELTFRGLRRIYQQHFGVGEEFSKMMSDRVDAKMQSRSTKPIQPSTSVKPNIEPIQPSTSVKPNIEPIKPSTSVKPKPTQGVRVSDPWRGSATVPKPIQPNIKPIQPSTSLKPSTSVSARGSGFRSPKIPKPNILKNMKVPGSLTLTKVGRIANKAAGPLSVVMAGLEIKQRKDEGQTDLQTGLGVGGSALGGQLGWMAGAQSGAIAGAALGSLIPGLGTAVGAGVGAIVGGLAAGYGGAMLGGKLADDFSGVNATKERKSRGAGGAIKGGFGLKDQSFKDAPKTQIMTDDKGKPFVGYKSMKNGKLHYSRGPQPGTGTSNPFEAFGRAINPGAYKDNDAKLAMQKQRIAQVNSLESYQKQGMAPDAQGRMMKQIGANSNQTQNDLKYRKNQQEKYGKQLLMPTTKPKVNVIFGDIPQKSAFNSKGSSSASPSVPSISSTHPKSEHRRQILAILGVK